MKFSLLFEELLTELSAKEIYQKYYNNLDYDDFVRIAKADPTSENEHIYIHIVDPKVNCEDETVNIMYKNKDNNTTYNGNVKVENLPTYATNYTLFEAYLTFKKNIK